MLYVNDHHSDEIEQRGFREAFARHPLLANCRGTRFAVSLADPAQWIALCLYLRDEGASVFPIHPTTPRDAAQRMARRARCHVLFFQDLADNQVLAEHEGDTAAVLIQMSSGTTGEPKCIERPWLEIEAELRSYNAIFLAAAHMTPVIACPVTHSYGLICGVLAALDRGQVPIIVTNMNPRYLVRRLAECERPLLYAAPALLTMLIRLLPAGEKLHGVMTSGAPLARSTFSDLQQRAEHVFQQYGCSEAGCVALNPAASAPEEMGYPLPHLKIHAGLSAEAPAEIQIEVSDRRISTRDLGYLDGRGMLCFLARLDDTINVAGNNVYPGEVEDVVLEYNGIQDAVVFKRADPYAGERVCLKFVASGEIDTDQLRSWCASQLSPCQVPVELVQAESIPRLPNGKVNRRQLATAGLMPVES